MCQLTVYDVGNDTLNPKFLQGLLSLNTIDGNYDGFGYYKLENNKPFKTEKSYIDWITSNESNKFKGFDNVNGLYHVRYASTNKEHITKETAHPHKLGSIILFHNGTLTKFYHKTLTHIFSQYDLKPEDITDSVEYLMALHYYSYGSGSGDVKGLTPETILSALNLFSGNYVFLILDTSNPDVMYIVKDDKVKPLSQTIIHKNKTAVGFILNSKWYMIQSNIFLYKHIYDSCDLKFDVSEVEGHKMYEYKFGEYAINEVCKLPTYRTIPELDKVTVRQHTEDSPKRNKESTFAGVDSRDEQNRILYSEFDKLISENYLGMDDLIVMYEICFGRSILTLSPRDVDTFMLYINKVTAQSTIRKSNMFSQLLAECKNKLSSYSTFNLQYPYMLNSEEDLKNALSIAVNANTSEV